MNHQKLFLLLESEITTFERIKKNNGLLVENPSLIKKFFVVYTKIMNYVFLEQFDMLVSEVELKTSSFDGFQKVFLPRTPQTLFETLSNYKTKKIKKTVVNYSLLSRIWSLSTPNSESSPVRNDLPFCLGTPFFTGHCLYDLLEEQASEPMAFSEFTERVNFLVNDYNLGLLEVFKLKFLRNQLLKNFFEMNTFPFSQLYFVFFLFFFDSQLISLIGELKIFHKSFDAVQDRNNLYRLETKTENSKFLEHFDSFITDLEKNNWDIN